MSSRSASRVTTRTTVSWVAAFSVASTLPSTTRWTTLPAAVDDTTRDPVEHCSRRPAVALDVEVDALAGRREPVDGGDVDQEAVAQDADPIGQGLDLRQHV